MGKFLNAMEQIELEKKYAELAAELAAERARADALAEAVEAFHARFADWIPHQSEDVSLSTALAFGQEYEEEQDALAAHQQARGE